MRSHRLSSRVLVIVAATLAALAIAAPVSAAKPTAVEIVSHMDFNQEGGFNTGDFEASGPAVDQGLICDSGTVEDTRIILAGFQSPTGRIQIPVRKTFTCDDGSGDIFIKIQVHLNLNTQTETFSWVVLGGTGDYSNLRGSGQGTTVGDGSDPQTGNFNNYTGFLIG